VARIEIEMGKKTGEERECVAGYRPQWRQIKAETVEKKVVIGSAVQKHGFVFDYNDCQKDCSSSSEEPDSF